MAVATSVGRPERAEPGEEEERVVEKEGRLIWSWSQKHMGGGRVSGMPPSSPILLGSSPLQQQFDARGKDEREEEGTKEGASPFLGSLSLRHSYEPG